jgi:hypothetical protein
VTAVRADIEPVAAETDKTAGVAGLVEMLGAMS